MNIFIKFKIYYKYYKLNFTNMNYLFIKKRNFLQIWNFLNLGEYYNFYAIKYEFQYNQGREEYYNVKLNKNLLQIKTSFVWYVPIASPWKKLIEWIICAATSEILIWASKAIHPKNCDIEKRRLSNTKDIFKTNQKIWP